MPTDPITNTFAVRRVRLQPNRTAFSSSGIQLVTYHEAGYDALDNASPFSWQLDPSNTRTNDEFQRVRLKQPGVYLITVSASKVGSTTTSQPTSVYIMAFDKYNVASRIASKTFYGLQDGSSISATATIRVLPSDLEGGIPYVGMGIAGFGTLEGWNQGLTPPNYDPEAQQETYMDITYLGS